jgi:hypothetical protein
MSVGTSLAFEGQGAADIPSADAVLFNLHTLVRNAHEAYEKTDKEAFDADRVAEDVSSDLRMLGDWIDKARGRKPVQMKVYCPDYDTLARDYPKAALWEPTSDKQKAYAKLAAQVIKKLKTQYGKLIITERMGIPEYVGRGIVLTHHVVDLTFVKGVGRLFLLESHTGLLKPFTLWYTKLTGGSELHYMPFNRLTIQVFGDRSTNFKTSSMGIRELVKKLAQDHKWTSATTLSRIRSTINGLPQSVDKAGLLLML